MLSASAALRSLLGLARRFRRSTRAIAATEFALVAPVLILVYVGAGELSQAVMTSRKVELLSRTLTDLASQQPTFQQPTSTPAPGNAISQSKLQSIMNAATAILAPAPLDPLTMTLSAVDIVNNTSGLCCDFKVRWSYTQAGALRPCATTLTPVDPTQPPSPGTVPSTMVPPATSLTSPMAMLVADVSYSYQGIFSSDWISFASGMSRTSYMLPRGNGQVIVGGGLVPAGSQSGTVCY